MAGISYATSRRYSFMTDVNGVFKRALLAAAISVLPLANTASAHGGGHGTGGSGGSSGSSGGSSSSGGHSSSGSNGGHSSSSTSGHSSASGKGGHATADPVSVSQSAVSSQTVSNQTTNGKNPGHRVFFQHSSTGYNAQNAVTANDDSQRRRRHLLFGFIPVY
ncbi:MAG TPA: hypothetical protein VHY59_03035 [Chthoniobacterales bacterium]|nr:hypothetical protein [Chthoniobacterales bacterium]